MQAFKGIQIRGKRLAEVRDTLALSQEELAARIGMTKNNLSRLEREDVTGINRESFRRLAELTTLTLSNLKDVLNVPYEGETDPRMPKVLAFVRELGLSPKAVAHYLLSVPSINAGRNLMGVIPPVGDLGPARGKPVRRAAKPRGRG